MNINDFLLNAKIGNMNLKRSKPISNKGTIEDIRKRTMKMLRPPGFHTYANTGAGNAMSSEPPKEKIEIEIDFGNEPEPTPVPVPAPAPAPAPAPDDKPSKPSRPMLGGEGGKQSKESKKEIEERKMDEVKEPKDQPPFNLSDPKEKKEFDDYEAYLVARYGKKIARPEVDKLRKDSEGFTTVIGAYRAIQKEINNFRRSDASRWQEWFHNIFVNFGDKIVEGLALGASTMFPANKEGIEKIKEFSKTFIPKTAKDAVGALKKLQKDLVADKPSWKRKLNAINKDIFDKLIASIEKEIGGIDDSIMN
jgi:hypothetical protein